MTQTPIAPEFSRPIDVARLRNEPARHSIAATPEERAALAARMGLVALRALTADLEMARAGDLISLRGTLRADVVQTCVVSLEDVHNSLEEDFAVRFAPAEDDGAQPTVFVSVDDDDPPDPIIDDRIDIGEVVAEHLALMLDPYPRLDSAKFRHISNSESAPNGEAAARAGPFAVLQRLKG